MQRRYALLMASVLTGTLWRWGLSDIGIGTQFADVVLSGLQPGGVYNIRELKGMPYSVQNTGDAPVEIVIETEVPSEKYKREGYEPILDPSWVRLEPQRHLVAAKGTAYSDIIISIPDDPQLKDRHFLAVIRAFTVGESLLQTGIRSFLRFSVGPGPEALEMEKKRKAMVDLNFEIWPPALYVQAESGKKHDVKKSGGKTLIVTNRSSKPLDLVVASETWGPLTGKEMNEFDRVEDHKWLTLIPERIKLAPFRVQEVKMVLNIPEGQEGRKLAFQVFGRLPIGTVVSTVNRVYVTVKEKK